MEWLPSQDAFKKYYDKIIGNTTDPGSLATELYSVGLIDQKTYREVVENTQQKSKNELTEKILSNVQRKIATQEKKYNIFLDVLSQNPVMENLCLGMLECKY